MTLRRMLAIGAVALGLGTGSAMATSVPPAASKALPAVTEVRNAFPDQNGPMSAMMLFIPEAELKEFDRPPEEAPHLSLLSSAHTGDIVMIKIVFNGAQGDAEGRLDVTYDLKVTQPDGALYDNTDEKDLPAVKGAKADNDAVFDNRASVVGLRFEAKDLRGTYTATAVLHDKVSGRDIPLSAEIELLP